MKAKSAFVSFFSVVMLLAIPAYSQDFLKRIKPWLNPDDSLDVLGAKQKQPPGPLFGSKNVGDKGVSLFSNFSSPLNESQSFSDSVQALWVRHFGSGLISYTDVATAVAIDGLGNVYVTGSSGDFGGVIEYGDNDYATVKYNTSGNKEWVARYNGSGNADDRATAIAVDATGNVYVTGYSLGSGTYYDYATVKYNASGVEQWVARYDGSIKGTDDATSIAVGDSGNVYVTGYSTTGDGGSDYATIKYNASGVQQWVARYNGPGNFACRATALAVDAIGNVYVTGYGYRFGNGARDYVTVKYNAFGVEQWVADNGPENGDDLATSLALDAAGNVYVTGSSEGSVTSDYATIKYNAFGVEQWVARYNGPGNSSDQATALAVDAAGNVYVTGYSKGSGILDDYATVKYNASGVEQWVTRYNGPGNANDQATALDVDAAGNVYVAGYSKGSGTLDDYATVKYDASGVEQWVARYTGPGNSLDHATALAVDTVGNVYVTGYSGASTASSEYYTTSSDYATVKYNTSGVEQWVARYNGLGNGDDRATAITVDAAGNIYVTGYSLGSSTSDDYVTAKYNASGVEQWVARYNGPENNIDRATTLVVDAAGNVYVAGYSLGMFREDYATIKYNAFGVQQWVARYTEPVTENDQATALDVDNAGNVYVTGYSYGSGSFGYDYATVKYDASGVEQWAVRYNGPGNLFDQATALIVDPAGNVYVTGYSLGSGTDYDYATVKYNASGVEQWVARYNGPGNLFDRATALAVDDSENVYVTGSDNGFLSNAYYYPGDYATVKYNVSGIEQWVARYYNASGNSTDQATALVVDAAGNVYVTGYSYSSSTSTNDYATIKYNASGVEKWVVRYNEPGRVNNQATALAVDRAGNVYVTGESSQGTLERTFRSVYTTIKYLQKAAPIAITNAATNVVHTVATLNGTVNPNNLNTTIKFEYGTTTSYGNTVTPTPSTATNAAVVSVRAKLSNLPLNTTYHYRLVATNSAGTANGDDQTFTTINHLPVRTDTIPQQNLTVDRTSFIRDLKMVFSDADSDTLIYSARSSNRSVATAEVMSNVLKVVPKASGNASITVVANDGYGGADSLAFIVTVNTPPRVGDPLGDRNLTVGSGGYGLRLNKPQPLLYVFIDPDGDKLSYSAFSSNTSIATSNIILSDSLFVSPVTAGVAKITVKADDKKGGETELSFNVIVREPNKPPIIKLIKPTTISSIQPGGKDIEIQIDITDDSGISQADLFYRKGGTLTFRRIGLTRNGTLYSEKIPFEEVTPSGLECYFEAIDIEGSKARNPDSSRVYIIRVDVAAPGVTNVNAQPSGTEQNAYRLISVPLDLHSKKAKDVLEDELGPYNRKTWRFYALRPDQANNEPYTEYFTTLEMRPGQAYWLIVKERGKKLDTGAGISFRTDTVFTITLHPKWNFISNPFTFPIPLRNVSLTSTKEPLSKIRFYRKAWIDTTGQTIQMQPFEGYAVFNGRAVNNLPAADTLIIDPNLIGATGALSKELITPNDENFSWSIRIIAQCQDARDIDNVIAVAPAASRDWDKLDQPEPPVIGEYVSVYFRHREWGKLATKYCTDIRPEPTDGEIWGFEVKTNISDKVNLSFDGIESVPEEDEIWLIDDVVPVAQNLRQNQSYVVAASSPEHPKRLKLVVGKHDFVEEKIAKTQVIPTTYEVNQNFPNPFNPATTIRYGLPHAERVTLKIYNLLGEEVVTLLDNELQAAGYHVAIWDGRNKLGEAVGNGVYIYRFRAGSFNALKKMALVK